MRTDVVWQEIFLTCSVVTVRPSREAFVRDGISGTWREGSGTDIFDEKRDDNNSVLSLSRIATESSGISVYVFVNCLNLFSAINYLHVFQ